MQSCIITGTVPLDEVDTVARGGVRTPSGRCAAAHVPGQRVLALPRRTA